MAAGIEICEEWLGTFQEQPDLFEKGITSDDCRVRYFETFTT